MNNFYTSVNLHRRFGEILYRGYTANGTRIQKREKFLIFLSDFKEIDHLLDYFELFDANLSKKTLNSYLKSVNNQ